MGTLDFMKPILHLLPEVSPPDRQNSFSEKMMWTGIALILFFVMYNIIAVGVDPKFASSSDFLQVVTASKYGSLLTISIGPLVLASIFLQLFSGAKIINVNMQDPDEKATFHGTQKVLAILLCFFEAFVFVYVGGLRVTPLFGLDGMFNLGELDASGALPMSAPYTQMLVMLQIAFGSIVLLFLDEVVSKHGIGSGISLFIAAGVSLAIVGGTVSLFIGENGIISILQSGGAEVISKAIIALAPLFFTVLVFFVIVYVEGIKIEIPLAFERARGVGTGFPIKLMYVSNIPVILASALLMNMSFMGAALIDKHYCVGGPYGFPGTFDYDRSLDTPMKCPGGTDVIPYIGYVTSDRQVKDGLMYYISPIYQPGGRDYGAFFSELFSMKSYVFQIPEIVHIISYMIFIMVICVIFGQFWVETAGMDAASVAKQLDSAGLQIPGYRRDPRIVQAMLEKYIPPIVIIGSAFVGLLSAVADLTGALGTGTGILLTVGIVYKMYQDIERQNVFESNALASALLGKK